MITIEVINGHNAARVEANGYSTLVMYKPNTTPIVPFASVEELELFAQEIEEEFNSRETVTPEVINDVIVANRIEWRPDLFWRRFTPEEQAILLEASKTDPIVDSFKMNLMMTPVVFSDDAITIAGMDYIVLKGYITPDRKNEIMGGN